MEKQFKVSLKYKANAQRYQVVKIIGPEVVIPIRGVRGRPLNPSNVRVSDMLTEEQTKLLGERAVLTTT